MRTRTLIFAFVIATSFYLVFKNRRLLTAAALNLNTIQASKNCEDWLPTELWVLMNSDKMPFVRIKSDNFYIYTDFEDHLMLSQSAIGTKTAWFNENNLYNVSYNTVSYGVLDKKYKLEQLSPQFRMHGTFYFGHWSFMKSSMGPWVASINVRYENPLYKAEIKCIEDQQCSWQANANPQKFPLAERPDLVKSLQSEGLLSSKEYELMETFCSHIEQNHTQKKLKQFHADFEKQCSLKVRTLSDQDLQGLCEKIRSKFIPAFKSLEGSPLTNEPVGPAETNTNVETDSSVTAPQSQL